VNAAKVKLARQAGGCSMQSAYAGWGGRLLQGPAETLRKGPGKLCRWVAVDERQSFPLA
jgi:hypothetical protein